MIDEQIYYLRWSRVLTLTPSCVDEQLSTPCPWQPKEIPNKSCREDLHTVAAWIPEEDSDAKQSRADNERSE